MRDFSLCCLPLLPTLLLLSILTFAGVSAEQLVLVGQPSTDATWQSSTEEGVLEFRVGETVHQVPREKLVRWSTPPANIGRGEAILVDGSRLVLADSWGGTFSLQLLDDTVTLATNRLGDVQVSPAQLRAALLNAPADALRRTKLRDKLLSDADDNDADADQIYLTNGDALSGRVSRIASQSSAGEAVVVFSLAGETQPVELPTKRVAGIRWGGDRRDISRGELAVGLRDGSYLVVQTLKTKADRFSTKLACGITFSGDVRDVIHLQTVGSQVIYLSDVEAVDYRHQPYLDIPWPYQRDRNVLGGPLVVGGHTYAKGIGMVTSARLTYRVPPQVERFAAEGAVDGIAADGGAAGQGSVVFRVYLLRENDWQQAFASPVVRGGDRPLAVSVKLAGAKEIALVTDYADRGDELDYADWLDAWFE